jgi:hypothetical protein
MTYEDLTTFTEVDANGRFTETKTRCTFSVLKRSDDNHYVYKNYGNNYFYKFIHKADILASNLSANGAEAVVYRVSNVLGDESDQTNGEFISVYFYRESPTDYRIYLSCGSSTSYYSTGATLIGTHYFINIIRDGTDVHCILYSDEARTTIVKDLQITIGTSNNFIYLFVGSSAFLACSSMFFGNLPILVSPFSEPYGYSLGNARGSHGLLVFRRG